MNTLFRERLLSRDVFTLSQESLLRQLQNGEIFLAASPSLGKLLSLLPESHPIWEQYEILSPILSDSGREPALSNNFEEQYVSTLFVKNSTQSQFQARLLAAFYLQNMEPSPEQKNALERSGLGDLLKNAEPMKSSGIDSRYTGPHPIVPTLSARAGTGGNNLPLALQPEPTMCICGNAIDRQPRNGGNGIGIQNDVAYTLTSADRHAIFAASGWTNSERAIPPPPRVPVRGRMPPI